MAASEPPRKTGSGSGSGLVPGLDEGLDYLLKAPAHIRRMTSPMFRLRHLVQFNLERLILRGALARLVVIALTIALVALAGGVAAFVFTGAFDDPFASTWWAFLRITDPGYLGDDEGTALRFISVTMTVGGLVLLIGALIAIMTQWLNQTIESLQQGLTPIVLKNHVLILGWNSRTPGLVEQLISSEGRVRRFLDHIGGKRLKIVILAEDIGPVLVQELKDRLGPFWRPRQIILRSGNAMRLEHLERVDFRHAAAVVLPAAAGSADEASDETVIKTLSTAATSAVGPWPLVVAEIIEPDHLRAGVKAYPGPSEIIAAGLLTSRVLAQTARFPGLGAVVEDLFDQEGIQVFLHELVDQVGMPLANLFHVFQSAVAIGVVRGEPRRFVPILSASERVEAGDLVAVIGHDFESSRPRPAAGDALEEDAAAAAAAPVTPKRVLVIGWNAAVPSLLAELDGYPEEFRAADVASVRPAAARAAMMERKGIAPAHLEVRQIECDATAYADLKRLEPHTYDVVMLLPSDARATADEADARSLMALLMLQELLDRAPRRPHVMVEAMVEASAVLFAALGVELLVTPKLRSHMLAQVALRRDLNVVFEHLLGVGGAEIALRPASAAAGAADFYELQVDCAARGEVALGMLRAGGVSELNPDKRRPLVLGDGDQVVVLTLSGR
ncbi:MAG: CASTOR/POLLUX-related putative ion channel [Gammaproteobacteria bacterium]